MLTIAWDVDDILNNLMHEWFHDFKKRNIGLQQLDEIEFGNLKQNPPDKIMGILKSDYLSSLDKFRLTKGYKSSEPNPEVLLWFEKHGEFANHIALTAVPINCVDASAAWVMKYFGKWIRSFNYIPSIREGISVFKYDCSKADFLKRTGYVDILVEDNQKNIFDAEDIGVKGFLVSKPWNNSLFSLEDTLQKLSKEIEDKKNG